MEKKIFFEGDWRTHKSDNWIIVNNPGTGEVIGEVANANYDDMKDLIDSAYGAFLEWKSETAYFRCKLLEDLYDQIMIEKEELAKIMTLENGKPYSESIGEVIYGANFIKWYSEEGKRVYGEIIPSSSKDKKIIVKKEAVGVVYSVTPWNFPFAMIARKIAPALAAGCTVIVKPAEETPLTAIKLFEIVKKVAFPKGVINLITGEPVELTKAIMDDSRVRKITFTGSTEVGKLLMKQAADTMKKISLELGGHAPLIVFEDADIKKAVLGTLASKFRNCGQVCIATNRVLVHKNIKEVYIKELIREVKKLKLGYGFDETTKLGPLINKGGYEKVENHINDAVKNGATILIGGKGYHIGDNNNYGYYYYPTVLTDVTESMKIFKEETFGPVLPIITFNSIEEAIRIANNTKYGLAAYFFTESISLGFNVFDKLDYGIIGFNTGAPSSAQAPFGGFKESGIGREGGHHGIEEYLEIKYISLGL